MNACVITLFTGAGIAVGSLIYLVSAIKGEQWCSPSASRSQSNGAPSNAKYISEAPKNPPPRRPMAAANGDQ